jgi:hypothetical protein
MDVPICLRTYFWTQSQHAIEDAAIALIPYTTEALLGT